MNNTEKAYIEKCKQLIEEKFHFENESGILGRRSLEHLAICIEECSGIRLSLSTLRRLWKKDYNQTPHASTLQGLVSILGYKDWQEFKSQTKPAMTSISNTRGRKKPAYFFGWIALPVAAAVLMFFWLPSFRSGNSRKQPVIKGPIMFTGSKTVSQGVPNTIIFKYDVGNVIADSFFFQQSWNELEKARIDPGGHFFSNIYYYPGFHRAKLIANDSIIKRFKVHITTDGWFPLVRRSFEDSMPLYLKTIPPPAQGAMHITRNDLNSLDLTTKDFILSYFNVREFENTNSDNFSLDTRIKCDSNVVRPCPLFELTIFCEEHIFYVDLMGKGCERNIAVKMGEVYQDGISHDLSALGRDLYTWQQLSIRVRHKQATIYLDEHPVHTITFKNDFGKLMGMVFNFAGTGAIDYVRLKNGEDKLIYEDDFDK